MFAFLNEFSSRASSYKLVVKFKMFATDGRHAVGQVVGGVRQELPGLHAQPAQPLRSEGDLSRLALLRLRTPSKNFGRRVRRREQRR